MAYGLCRRRLSQGDKDRAKYIAVGEADNFVLAIPQTQAVDAGFASALESPGR